MYEYFIDHTCLTQFYSDLILHNLWMNIVSLRGGADKYLARSGTTQAAGNKLGIYLIYSPRSSIHFLVPSSNFCKTLKKNQKFVRPTRSPWQQWPLYRTKNCELSIVFSVRGTGGSPTGPDPENRGSDPDSARWSGALSCKNKTPLVTFPRQAFFLQSVLQLHKQRWVILRVDSLALWKIINEEDDNLIPKKTEARTFPADFCTRNILGRGEPLCRHSIDCCFVSGS